MPNRRADQSIGATPLLRQLGTRSITTENLENSSTPIESLSIAPTPAGHDLDLSKHDEQADEVPLFVVDDNAGISAADYDPILDKKDDEEKRRKDQEVADGVGEPIAVDDTSKEPEYEEVEIEVDEDEEEEVDMFAAFGDEVKPKKKRKVLVRRLKGSTDGVHMQVVKPKKTLAMENVDNVDDTDGYYRITPGEILDDGRYEVTITLGKGMFSAVVKAKVLKAVGQERRQDVVGKEVAIKVIRSQESM